MYWRTHLYVIRVTPAASGAKKCNPFGGRVVQELKAALFRLLSLGRTYIDFCLIVRLSTLLCQIQANSTINTLLGVFSCIKPQTAFLRFFPPKVCIAFFKVHDTQLIETQNDCYRASECDSVRRAAAARGCAKWRYHDIRRVRAAAKGFSGDGVSGQQTVLGNDMLRAMDNEI